MSDEYIKDPDVEFDDQALQGYWEYHKCQHQFFRHLSTLSTGAIVILSAFVEKIFITPKWKPLLAVSVFLFMVTLLSNVVSYYFFLHHFPRYKAEIYEPQKADFKFDELILGLGLGISAIGFLLAMITVTIFLIKNLV